MMLPRIFIGSSREGIEIARAIQLNLQDVGQVIVWENDVFRLSDYTSQSLERELSRANYGIFVLSPDDIATVRGKRSKAPRDNVIFETGLFIGRLGLSKTFLVHPDRPNIKIPTDLLGVTTAQYRSDMLDNYSAALGPACTKIRTKVKYTWATPETATWDELVSWIKQLGTLLRQSPSLGGFAFEIIVGLNRGGIIVADLLARHYGSNMPVLSIWADRRTTPAVFAPPQNWTNAYLVETLTNDRITNILLVDDITRRGITLNAARQFLSDRLPGKCIKTAVLVLDQSLDGYVDYHAVKADAKNLKMPFSVLG